MRRLIRWTLPNGLDLACMMENPLSWDWETPTWTIDTTTSLLSPSYVIKKHSSAELMAGYGGSKLHKWSCTYVVPITKWGGGFIEYHYSLVWSLECSGCTSSSRRPSPLKPIKVQSSFINTNPSSRQIPLCEADSTGSYLITNPNDMSPCRSYRRVTVPRVESDLTIRYRCR